MGLNLVKGIEIIVITIQTLLGPKEILLVDVAYILVFYINLACLKFFNKKYIQWDNKKNLLYKNDYKIFAYYEDYYSYLTLKYNKLKILFAI